MSLTANSLYPKAKERMISGSAIDLAGQTVHCCLVSSSYTYNDGHVLWDTSVKSHMLSGSNTGSLSSKTFASGVFDAADITYTAVSASGYGAGNLNQFVIFQSGTAGATDLLIAHFVSSSGAVVNITTNGGDVTISWNASGIFTL